MTPPTHLGHRPSGTKLTKLTKFEYQEAQKLEKLNGKNDLFKLNGISAPHPPVNGKVHSFTEEIFLKPSLSCHQNRAHFSSRLNSDSPCITKVVGGFPGSEMVLSWSEMTLDRVIPQQGSSQPASVTQFVRSGNN